MKNEFALSAFVVALLAGTSWAQTDSTTNPDAQSQSGQTEAPATQGEAPDPSSTAPATQGEATDPAATAPATEGDATDPASTTPAAGDPRQALAAAAERLEEVRNNIGSQSGDANAEAGTADGTAPATGQALSPEAQAQLTQALDEFDQAVQQYGQSTQTEQAQSMVTQLQTQSQTVREQLSTDVQGAMEGIGELTQIAMTLPQTEISAEARNLQDRTIVSSDGEEVGQVKGMLVTAEGQVEAVIIGDGGTLGLGATQRVVAWDQIQLQGEQIMVNLTQDQVDQLGEYVAE